jgi:DNA-binding HxlR family transcriptional regulator
MKQITKRSECPISFSLDYLGDKWTLLIVRDILLNDKNTFGDFLQSGEGVATNILADRLKMLEAENFIMKYAVPGKARIGYCLTAKGVGLIPIILELAIWGAGQIKSTVKKELTAAIKKDKSAVIRKLAEKHLDIFNLRKKAFESND